MITTLAVVASLALAQTGPQRPVVAEPAVLVPAEPPAPSRGAFRAILDEHVESLKRHDPVGASTKGDLRFNDRLGDNSVAAHEAWLAELTDRLKRVEAIDGAGLAEPERTDYGILHYDLSTQLAGARFHGEQIPISTMGGPQIGLPQMERSLPFRTEKQYDDYASRLEQVARNIDNDIERMKLGLAARRVPPKVTMGAAVDQCLAQCAPDIAKDPTLSPFYRPFLSRPAGDAAAARAKRAISGSIVPAYRRLAEFLAKEYIPACRDTIGLCDTPDGEAAYAHAVLAHTTLPLTPEEVHQRGLSEVARIQEEMLGVIGKTDFPRRAELKGNELLRAFTDWLRHEPRFFYGTPEELLDGYRAIAKRIDPQLPRLFGTLPRNSYGVRPLPLFVAGSSPTAYYYGGSMKGGIPGYFMANTLHLDQRPKYSMLALTLHEAVPGHHLQLSLQDELGASGPGGGGGQHEYHQWIGFTAFVEGWGLYSERLGLEMDAGDGTTQTPWPASDDQSSQQQSSKQQSSNSEEAAKLGFYANPYDNFGRLSFEMWRACRLVIDSGIHAKHWTREQAVGYLLAHTGLAPFDAEREVDRYISWPGQALGYKVGELKLRDLRAAAEKALGDGFDRRAFHDVVLGAGSVPLPVLEQRVRGWIAERRPPR